MISSLYPPPKSVTLVILQNILLAAMTITFLAGTWWVFDGWFRYSYQTDAQNKLHHEMRWTLCLKHFTPDQCDFMVNDK